MCFIGNASDLSYLTKYCQQEGGLAAGIANALRAGRANNHRSIPASTTGYLVRLWNTPGLLKNGNR